MNRRRFMVALAGAGSLRGSGASADTARSNATILPKFTDITHRSGIDFYCSGSHTPQKYLLETMVGGVAMFDYDGDGNLDLFFVNGAALSDSMPPGSMPDKSAPRFWNRLYHNNGDGTFTDVTEKAGVKGHSFGQGVAVGDFDNDGRQDIYVTNFGRNILYRNNGDGTFTDITDKAGVSGGGWSTGACFVDYDRDGHLDLIVVRYLDWDLQKNVWCGDESRHFRAYCHPNVFKPATYLVYHNNGDGTFTDVSDRCGIGLHPGNGLGVDFNDADGDGWPDILVANDTQPQQLFRNNHDDTFTDIAERTGLAFDEDGRTYSGMGLSFDDFNNDGRPDVFIDNLANQKYALYRNAGGAFDYVTPSSGVGAITLLHSAWGALFIDYDNDGWKDLLIAQSHVMDNIEQTQPSLHYKEPLLLMRNQAGHFEDVSKISGAPFRVPLAARGVAFGDLNNDGFIDAAVNCNEGHALILQNSGNRNNWLLINTVGTSSNRDGVGARIHIQASGRHQYAMVKTAGSYLSASDKRVHFGLGDAKKVDLLEISWPSGITQRIENVSSNQKLTVREPVKKAG